MKRGHKTPITTRATIPTIYKLKTTNNVKILPYAARKPVSIGRSAITDAAICNPQQSIRTRS